MLIDSPLRDAHIAQFRERLPEHVARLSWSDERLEQEREAGFRATLAWAKAKSPWHAARLAEVHPSSFAVADLRALPMMTKADVMANWDNVVADHRLTLAQGNEHILNKLHHATHDFYYLDEFEIFATGGSSGTRGVFVWGWQEFVEIACATYRYQARDESAASETGRRVLAVIEAGETVHGSLFLFSISPDPAAEVQSFPAATPTAQLVEQLNEAQPTHINAFASAIGMLAGEALAGRLRISPKRIATNSEPLLPEARAAAREAWGIEINNMWGCVEAGHIGVECDAHEGLHLSDDLVITEFVDHDNQPATRPEAVEKLLITSLYNRTIPLIRYELTDIAIPLDIRCSCGSPFPLIGDIHGRADDAFHYAGDVAVHPLVFRTPLGQNPMIEEYQVRQTPAGAAISVVTRGEVDLGRLASEVTQSVREGGLAQPEIEIAAVDQLQRHAETGKLKRFIPLER